MNLAYLARPAFATLRAFLPALPCAVLLYACNGATGTTPTAGMPGARGGALRAADAAAPTFKIYVDNIGDNTVTTYKPDGTQTSPTITAGLDYPNSIAVDANGKIYVVSFNGLRGPSTSGTVTTYKPDGTQTTPTIVITEKGYVSPSGIAVDTNGKIYVLSSNHNGTPGTVRTYKPDGTPTTPTFRTGENSSGLAMDNNGKIYVTNDEGPGSKGSVTTYKPDGTPTAPTITRGLSNPSGVAVDANGKIYVANDNATGETHTGSVTIYAPDGRGPLEVIHNGAYSAVGVVVDANGKIYVSNGNVVKTYKPDGTRTTPTISAGLFEPFGLAVH